MTWTSFEVSRFTACSKLDQITRNWPAFFCSIRKSTTVLISSGVMSAGSAIWACPLSFEVERGLLARPWCNCPRAQRSRGTSGRRARHRNRARLSRPAGRRRSCPEARSARHRPAPSSPMKSKPGVPSAEIVLDEVVAAPVRDARGVQRQDQIVLDQWLLHAADDVDELELLQPAGGEKLVHHGRGRVADRDEVHLVARLPRETLPAAGIAHADVGHGHGRRGRGVAHGAAAKAAPASPVFSTVRRVSVVEPDMSSSFEWSAVLRPRRQFHSNGVAARSSTHGQSAVPREKRGPMTFSAAAAKPSRASARRRPQRAERCPR